MSELLEDVRKLRMLARGDAFKKSLPGYLEHSSIRGGSVATQQAEALRQARRIRKIRVPETTDAQWEETKRLAREAMNGRRLGLSSLERLIEFASDPRPRNSLGEYTSDPGEGVDPNQMAAAYGPPEVSESHMERVKNFFLKRRQAAGAAQV